MFGRNKSSEPAPRISLRKLFPRPILCYVTDRRSLGQTGESLESAAEIAGIAQKIRMYAAARIDWIQIREKDLPETELIALTRSALRSCFAHPENDPRPTGIFVNDRLDTVLTTKPFGAHLGEQASLAEALERLEAHDLRRSLLVGKSCHSLESAKSAEREGADYIFFGPVFATPSKAAFGVPQGLDRLAEVCRSVQIPVLAIGGITGDNFAQCLQAGAVGIAAIRLFQDSPDPAATLRSLREGHP